MADATVHRRHHRSPARTRLRYVCVEPTLVPATTAVCPTTVCWPPTSITSTDLHLSIIDESIKLARQHDILPLAVVVLDAGGQIVAGELSCRNS